MDVAAITGVIAVILAVPGAYLAFRQWRREEEVDLHLYIPAPDRDQNPLSPDFWVFPPVDLKDGQALVIGGRMINAGPDAARSVRVYADPEVPTSEAQGALEEAFDVVAANNPGREHQELWREFVKHYRTRDQFDPLLREGEELRFLVVAHYDHSSPYIKRIGEEGERIERSRDWVQDRRQAHAVHAAFRTGRGGLVEFGPSDLCAPGEDQR